MKNWDSPEAAFTQKDVDEFKKLQLLNGPEWGRCKVTPKAAGEAIIETYVTIAGYNSIGKKTLINSLLKSNEHRSLFDIKDDCIVEAFGQNFQPLAKMLASNADVKIHQWHSYTHHWIERLKNTNHKIFILSCDSKIHHKRWLESNKNVDWIQKTTPDDMKSYHKNVIDKFNGFDYKIIEISNIIIET